MHCFTMHILSGEHNCSTVTFIGAKLWQIPNNMTNYLVRAIYQAWVGRIWERANTGSEIGTSKTVKVLKRKPNLSLDTTS